MRCLPRLSVLRRDFGSAFSGGAGDRFLGSAFSGGTRDPDVSSVLLFQAGSGIWILPRFSALSGETGDPDVSSGLLFQAGPGIQIFVQFCLFTRDQGSVCFLGSRFSDGAGDPGLPFQLGPGIPNCFSDFQA